MGPPRVSITRRPPLEMALPNAANPRAGDAMNQPRAVAVGQSAEMPLTDSPPTLPGEFDLNLELEVPAFLRRNEG
jgi:hypothetical protein